MTNTSMRTVADLQALDQPTQGLVTADYPASAHTQKSAGVTQLASNGHVAPLGYSEVPDDDPLGSEYGYRKLSKPDNGESETAHSPRRLVVSAAASILAVGAVALVISLTVGIRTAGEELPISDGSAPSSQSSGAVAPGFQHSPPASSPGRVLIQQPSPGVRIPPQVLYPPPAAQTPAAVQTPSEAVVIEPPQENPEPPIAPESVPGDPASTPEMNTEPTPEENAEPAPEENAEPAPEEIAEPAPEDDFGSAAEADREAAPEDAGPVGIDPFTALDRVPEDPRLSIGGPPIILAPTAPLLPSD